MDMMKWKQSCTLCISNLLSSISMLNSRSSASCTKTHVLISMLSFSEFQFVLKVMGTPSHLSGSACLKRSPTHLMIRLANTVGYSKIVTVNRIPLGSGGGGSHQGSRKCEASSRSASYCPSSWERAASQMLTSGASFYSSFLLNIFIIIYFV